MTPLEQYRIAVQQSLPKVDWTAIVVGVFTGLIANYLTRALEKDASQ